MQPVWVNDGHLVVPTLHGREPQWGWWCPYDGLPFPDPTPYCRQRHWRNRVDGCIVAPWFNQEGGVAQCLFPAGRHLLRTPAPIKAEYAWFGSYFRWRPVG